MIKRKKSQIRLKFDEFLPEIKQKLAEGYFKYEIAKAMNINNCCFAKFCREVGLQTNMKETMKASWQRRYKTQIFKKHGGRKCQ